MNKIRKNKALTHQKMELLKEQSNKNVVQDTNTNNELKNNEMKLSSIHNNNELFYTLLFSQPLFSK